MQAAGELAKCWGYDVCLLGDVLQGDTRDLAQVQAAEAREDARNMSRGDAPVVLMSDGAYTVTRRASATGLDAEGSLANNDAHAFLPIWETR